MYDYKAKPSKRYTFKEIVFKFMISDKSNLIIQFPCTLRVIQYFQEANALYGFNDVLKIDFVTNELLFDIANNIFNNEIEQFLILNKNRNCFISNIKYRLAIDYIFDKEDSFYEPITHFLNGEIANGNI